MNLFTGKSQLLALLFLVLSCITLCLSSPTQSLADPVPLGKRTFLTVTTFGSSSGPLRRQAPGDNLRRYQQILDEIEANPQVDVNTEQSKAFDDKPTVLGSHGFQTCFGIVVLSDHGVILGHYNPSQTDIDQAKEHIPKLYQENKDRLAGATAYLLASVDLWTEEYIDPELTSELEDMINSELGLEPHIVKYTDQSNLLAKSSDELRDDDDYDEWVEKLMHGEILVKHPGGKDPKGAELIFVHLQMQKDP
ncbi:uncharacterized protein LDX57_008405 [Aspergillus melleus]|uniref:uncharacterized protein n=1 Tax=Aspergillus melleus TaxID=138277 RepID=UPI001E8E4EF8|nr:uncharacterized protein LDX57_008405 [Aspergillus melleus]KAH8430742.1 hypothetical protein LDX57_008405 [Aspergillus melleus]